MTMDQKQQVALFRYAVIAPLETGTSDPSISNNEFFRRAAQKTYTGPDGKEATVLAGTIEKWHLAYSKGGFEALLPQSRKDEGISRKLTPDLQSDIRFLLAGHPRITAAEIHRILLSRGSICLNGRTLCAHCPGRGTVHLSRQVHENESFMQHVQKYQFGKCPFWGESYFITTTGTTSMEKVKEYIESQRTEEHKRKYVKSGKYKKQS